MPHLFSLFKRFALPIVGLLAISFALTWIPYVTSEGHLFPPSPDPYGLACGVTNMRITGSPFESAFPKIAFEPYSVCWVPTYLPTLLLHRAVAGIFNLDPLTTINILTPLAVVALGFLVFGCARRLGLSDSWSWFLAFLSVVTNGVSRSSSVNPQNLYGYALILLLIFLYARRPEAPMKTTLFLMLIVAFLLYFTHPLSFVIGLASFGILFLVKSFHQPKAWLGIAGLLLCVAILFFLFPESVVSQHLRYVWDLWGEIQIGSKSAIHPWWNYPFAWGYLLTLFGFLGLLVWPRSSTSPSHQPLLLSFALAPLLLAQGDLIGVSIVPGRMIAFLWIPLLLGVPYGLQWFNNRIGSPRTLPLLALMLFSATALHSITFRRNDFLLFGRPNQPSEHLLQAIAALPAAPTAKDGVLSMVRDEDETLRNLPGLYAGPAILYPGDQIGPRKKLSGLPNTSVRALINDRVEPQTSILEDLHALLLRPRHSSSRPVLEKYNIRYVLLSRKDPLLENLQGGNPAAYTIYFENPSYVVFTPSF